jgi:TetR/AcrR family transcriptional regulator
MGAARPTKVGRPRSDPRPIEREPRDEIVAVGARLFRAQGFGQTTMRQIAAEAGLQQSSVYYYFSSKEAVLEALVEGANRLSLERLARITAAAAPASVGLYRIVRFDVRLLCELPYDINEVLRLSALQEDHLAGYWQDRQALNDGVEAMIAEGISAGDLVEVDARLAALTLLSNDEAVQNWYRPIGAHHLAGRADGEPYSPVEIGDFLADLALSALLRDRRALPAVRRRAQQADRQLDAGDGPGAAAEGTAVG